jgi:gluconate 2-dehydrogenase gamma chain
MHRRELLQIVGAVALTPLLAPLSAEERVEVARTIHQKRKNAPLRVLTPAQAALVTAVAERIIPRTDTPGATEADVTGFVDMLLADWYKDEDRDRFLRGLAAMEAEAVAMGGKPFAEAAPSTQDALLTRWDSSESGPETATANFKRMKSLTIYGFFTSEIAVREVTKPVIFHPAFEGCVPFPAGAK